MFAFGVLGFIMKKFNYPIAPLIIGLVLGELTEISFRRGLRMADFDLAAFLFRPIGGTILLMAFISLVYSIYSSLRKKPGLLEGTAAPAGGEKKGSD